MATRMQQRRGTAAEWASVNPVLAAGEIGYETDTGKFKIGDGTNAYADLTSYGTLDSVIDAAPGTLDTLNELAAAINDDPDFFNSVDTAITTAVSQLNTSIADTLTGAKAYTDTELAAAVGTLETVDTTLRTDVDQNASDIVSLSADITTNTGDIAANTADIASLQADLATETSTRSSADATLTADIAAEATARATADTALEAYADQAEADAIATAAADATSKADAAQTAAEATAASALTSHNSSTINVHGIADTSVLATDSDVSSAVSTHAAVTTNVHGIADTSVLATTSDVSTAQTAAEGHADGILATHEADTTNVHGIADTSDLALLSGADQTFSGNITVSGNFTVSGTTTTVSTQDLVVNDPMIYIGEGSTSNTADLGIVGSFDDGTYQHAGIVRDASDDIWKLFKGVTDEPSTTINFAQGSLDDLAVNNIEVAGVVFTDGTQTLAGVPSITSIASKTASYTLTAATERDTIIEVDSASATTVTIPADSSVNFPVGSTLDIIQVGAGQVTIAGDTGVTVNGTPGTKLRTQWSSVTLLKRAANSWLVFGDTAA